MADDSLYSCAPPSAEVWSVKPAEVIMQAAKATARLSPPMLGSALSARPAVSTSTPSGSSERSTVLLLAAGAVAAIAGFSLWLLSRRRAHDQAEAHSVSKKSDVEEEEEAEEEEEEEVAAEAAVAEKAPERRSPRRASSGGALSKEGLVAVLNSIREGVLELQVCCLCGCCVRGPAAAFDACVRCVVRCSCGQHQLSVMVNTAEPAAIVKAHNDGIKSIEEQVCAAAQSARSRQRCGRSPTRCAVSGVREAQHDGDRRDSCSPGAFCSHRTMTWRVSARQGRVPHGL